MLRASLENYMFKMWILTYGANLVAKLEDGK